MKNTVSTSIPIERLGPPGIPGELVIVPQIAGEVRNDEMRLKDSAERRFKVSALLGKHSSRAGEISATFSHEEGDSYLLAHDEASFSKLYIQAGEMFLYHNSNRELSLIQFECDATSISEAKAIFLEAIYPFLDRTSFLANIPIHIQRVSCTDLTHQIQSIDYVGPYSTVKLNPHHSSVHTELFPVYALYRESKNNPSSFYKFLCYFKILEGIYGSLRPDLFKRAKAASTGISTRKETVPTLYEPIAEHAALQGKPIKEVFDTRFRPEYRDAIAHFLLDEDQPLNVSEPSTAIKFSSEISLIEPCVKVVIETHEAYLDELNNNSV